MDSRSYTNQLAVAPWAESLYLAKGASRTIAIRRPPDMDVPVVFPNVIHQTILPIAALQQLAEQ